ncbi:MAG: hypothetical protein JSV12_03385 [Candidatus Bathyarchaeota archaeon]|nr:MAG: hypothetical protein JSV12_03385 [Candidatus Bathyarchaeota archaeon]
MTKPNKNSILSKVSKAIIRAKKESLPVPILDSSEETRIAYNLLIDVEDLDYIKYNRDHMVNIKDLAIFSVPELAPVLSRLYRDLLYDEIGKLVKNTEWLAWRKGKLSLREAQTLMLRGEGYETRRIRDIFGFKSSSSVENLFERAVEKAKVGIRTYTFYVLCTGNLLDWLGGLEALFDVFDYDYLPSSQKFLGVRDDELHSALSDLHRLHRRIAKYVRDLEVGLGGHYQLMYYDPFENPKELKKEYGIYVDFSEYTPCHRFDECMGFFNFYFENGGNSAWNGWLKENCPKNKNNKKRYICRKHT